MEKDTRGQEHIWGSKLLVRFYFLWQMVHVGVFNRIILTLYGHDICSFNVHYYTLQCKRNWLEFVFWGNPFWLLGFTSLGPGGWLSCELEFSLVDPQMPTSAGSIHFSGEFSNLLPGGWITGFQQSRALEGKGLVLVKAGAYEEFCSISTPLSLPLCRSTCLAVWCGGGNMGFIHFLGTLSSCCLFSSMLHFSFHSTWYSHFRAILVSWGATWICLSLFSPPPAVCPSAVLVFLPPLVFHLWTSTWCLSSSVIASSIPFRLYSHFGEVLKVNTHIQSSVFNWNYCYQQLFPCWMIISLLQL